VTLIRCAGALVYALLAGPLLAQAVPDPALDPTPDSSGDPTGSAQPEDAAAAPFDDSPLIKALTTPRVKYRAVALAVPMNVLYRPLTLVQKYEFAVLKITGAGAWPTLAIHAGLDQIGVLPRQWGTGMDSMAVRMASHFGRSFVRQNIAFMVRAVDHEDPRYFILGEGSNWRRTRWALSRTFVARNDNGGWMPAYSRFVASYSMPMIATDWSPAGFSATQGIRSTTVGLGFVAIGNVWQEFLPDLKRVLRGHPENGGHLARWRAKIH